MGRFFGTNGIREVVGENLNARFVAGMVGAIAEVVGDSRPMLVAWDGRTSSPAFARIAAGTLSVGGLDVLELAAMPTPCAQYSVPRLKASCAVVITASHNPPEFNGIKGIADDGLEFTTRTEEAVEKAYLEGRSRTVRFDQVGSIRAETGGIERYLNGIRSLVDVEAIRKRNLRVVVDCGNGASATTAPLQLGQMGLRYVSLNGNLDGVFPGRSSEPTEANLRDLVASVPATRADLGVAHDGDADRAVFVDDRGRFIPGERVLTLLAREEVQHAGGGTIVTPVTSSQSVEDVVTPFGGKVHYTRVGSPVVARAMVETGAIFGGEENGGYLFPKHQCARDGAMTLAKVLELVARTGKKLSQLLDELPPYFLVKKKVACPIPLRQKVLSEVPSMLDAGKDAATRVVTLDGVKVITPKGWVLVRPSGTEPIYRVFAEARDPKAAEELAATTLSKVEELIRKLQGTAP
ncbi:MAG: phosphoglucosamine mutase [Euryarchaeota archaeon]|nr:phosphoglucosamine mutase [Euryarchaeota archaeon]MDE1836213.1 phosphoglucosamine mutase [Euryarchaeota archaeon]MDE1880866.1 phosphoglucosamine mutase [Euryarchaeota archaeon]MDE2045026.1 phosphoglucosamine mutase [Thermoplasmata archaeon]